MLSALIWLPIVGAIVIAIFGGDVSTKNLRQVALVFTTAVFGIAIFLLTQFDVGDGRLQLNEYLPWVETIGLSYSLGIDGLSLPLVLLNGLLGIIAVFSSHDIQRPRLYYSLVLLLCGGVMGAFLSQNLLLFFLFYEVELIPLYLLIAIWGGERRTYAATKFLIYTAISGVFLLAGFFGLASLAATVSTGISFNLADLDTQMLTGSTQIILLVLILLGFGIKIPLVPLHTWLPDAHVEASTPISTILAGVLLKLGTYGLLRFGVALFPSAWQDIAPIMATWAVVSVLYGCLTAITQKDMKKMVAYSSVGHMGYILLGFAADTPLSILGATMQMVSHGLISAMLFLLVGVVYKKTGTRQLGSLSGLFNPERGLPLAGSFIVMAAMASAGIPGMVGFIAEFVVFRGSFTAFPVQTLLCMLGTGLTAVYFLVMVDRVFFGRFWVAKGKVTEDIPPTVTTNIPKSGFNDLFPNFVLALLIVVLGLQPSWLSRWIETAAQLVM
ncbi:MAG: NADH-quinone oxidoreductase subunit M [Pseudanabaena sp. ELA607]